MKNVFMKTVNWAMTALLSGLVLVGCGGTADFSPAPVSSEPVPVSVRWTGDAGFLLVYITGLDHGVAPSDGMRVGGRQVDPMGSMLRSNARFVEDDRGVSKVVVDYSGTGAYSPGNYGLIVLGASARTSCQVTSTVNATADMTKSYSANSENHYHDNGDNPSIPSHEADFPMVPITLTGAGPATVNMTCSVPPG